MALLIDTRVNSKEIGEVIEVGYPVVVEKQPDIPITDQKNGNTETDNQQNNETTAEDSWKKYLYIGIGAFSIAILGWLVYKNR
ncbi:hypothetical protein J7L13_03140 [bacterium]|nr:hypothetical protein [bacterium]